MELSALSFKRQQNFQENLQFGFEVEYLPSKVAHWDIPLLWTSGFSHLEAWRDLSSAQRLTFLEETYHAREYGENTEIFSSHNIEALTENVFFDDNGNIEIKSGPFESFNEMKSQLEKCLETFGKGSLQGTVSLPRSVFFEGQHSVQENLGLLIYFAEKDILERIREGFKFYKEGKTNLPINTFIHPHLGPLNHRRHAWLKEYIESNANGKRLRDKDLLRVGKREQSFKYIGATTYRPDIGGKDRLAFEVRDAHVNFVKLIGKMQRLIKYLQEPKGKFIKYSCVKPFDSEKCWDQLPSNLSEQLKSLFPNLAPTHIQSFSEPLYMYDVFRNFTYPLRDWNEDFKGIDIGVESSQVKSAQKKYLAKIKTTVESEVGVEDQKKQIQISLCEFFVDCPIELLDY